MHGAAVHSAPAKEHVDGIVHVQNVNALHIHIKMDAGFQGVASHRRRLVP